MSKDFSYTRTSSSPNSPVVSLGDDVVILSTFSLESHVSCIRGYGCTMRSLVDSCTEGLSSYIYLYEQTLVEVPETEHTSVGQDIVLELKNIGNSTYCLTDPFT